MIPRYAPNRKNWGCIIANIYLFRRKTAADWTSQNPVLMDGELGLEKVTRLFKFGDGVTAWNSLPYAGASVGVVPWGAITGTLSAQTDLQNALNAKQATLVSGTSIKTVNGNSLLGAGDLVISGGGGSGITALTGDVTASGTGSVAATIAAGAVTVSKMADLTAGTILGNNTGGAAAPIALSTAQVKAMLAIAAGDVSGLASIATSGSASDLGSGTLPAARFNDTAHGSRAGGSLHPAATTSVAGFMAAADKTKLDAITGTNTGDQTIALTGDVTGSGTGSFAATIANDAVTNAKAANMANGTIKGRATAGTGDPEDLTASQATALLDAFTSGTKGLAPASGGGTSNFLRADGSWAAPGGGGTPGGSSGEVQYNNAGAFAGAADVEIEGGQLRLPSISTPSGPAASGLKLFGKDYALSPMPHVLSPSDVIPWPVQPMLGEGNYRLYLPGGGTTDTQIGWPAPTGQGTATAANLDAGVRGHLQRKEWLVTSASTTAVAAFRMNTAGFEVNSGSAGLGGFFGFLHGGPSTGVTNGSHRFFMGLADSSAASDVNPSSLLLIVGIGYDSADTNVQFMHNDGSGAATKIDLGASFPKPNADRGFTYRLRMFAPPGTTRTLSYEVTYLETGAVATGTVTTDLPNTNSFLTPKLYTSVGGVSAVTGVCVGPIAFQTEPVA